MIAARQRWFLTGLFLTTVATLLLELLDTRLLSVLSWYHLSFFAVSIAMFGMAAGAISVYLGKQRFEGEAARAALADYGMRLAWVIPASHVVNLVIPLHTSLDATNLLAWVASTLVLAAPFYVSGVIVSIALTRIPGSSGLIYGVDLAGAALGSLLIVPLLGPLDISGVALLCGAIGALAAACFRRCSGHGRMTGPVVVAALLVAWAVVASLYPVGPRVIYPKGQHLLYQATAQEHWTIHGQVAVWHAIEREPYYWGKGEGADHYRVVRTDVLIDGSAGTSITAWDGKPASIEWVKHDVTALPYHLRWGGDVAVIGVGGGRDLLTALWAESRTVTGIEINRALITLLEHDYRGVAHLADHPAVTLVHDEARSYLTRSRDQFDVLQMSLIDTWAATGSGAFTLSENGLYTVEAWKVFLGSLKPGGILSVSRWYSPKTASETSRMLSLATAALLLRGVPDPSACLALAGRAGVATLLASTEPLGEKDLATLAKTAETFGFDVLLAPGQPPADPFLARIVQSRSLGDLDASVAHATYDYSPPTDQRPYFFNILKPSSLLRGELELSNVGVIAQGNVLATATLALLWLLSALLVIVAIAGPLVRAGMPTMERVAFAHGLAYFALIGTGFMLVQVPLIQRFSVYLGHPVYAVAVILFAMILASGVGSLLSDAIRVEAQRRWLVCIPLGIAGLLVLVTSIIQPLIDTTIHLGIVGRCAVAVALVASVALPLGTCFPIGLRLVRRLSTDAMPWMWGINGACGVLASVSAVGISMVLGIDAGLLAAAVAYALLAVPALALWRRGRAASPAAPAP